MTNVQWAMGKENEVAGVGEGRVKAEVEVQTEFFGEG